MKRGSAGGKITAIILRREALERYYKNPNICKNCKEVIQVKENEKASITRRKKFCDNSCAATYSNKRRERKKKSKVIRIPKKRTNLIDNKTKKELFENAKSWQVARNTIRKHAVRTYFKHFKQRVCEECGYDLHIDVCHLKSVSKFSDNAFIREINHINNLIGLCPNHHWELDHKQLKGNYYEK